MSNTAQILPQRNSSLYIVGYQGVVGLKNFFDEEEY
jgi:hypothetical protein